MSTNRLINDSVLTDIAGAIREKNRLTNLYHPQDMAAAIRGLKLAGGMGIVIGDHIVDGKWVRPSDWPDLDSLQREDDTLYMTVDNSGRIDDTHVSFAVTTQSGQYSVEVGDVVNGQFVGGAATMFNSGVTCKLNSGSFNTDYPVLRIKAEGMFANFAFNAYGALNGHTYADARQSAIVEAVGQVSKYNGGVWGTWYLEHDARVIKSITSGTYMGSTWNSCYSLQSLDLSGWDTSRFNFGTDKNQSVLRLCRALRTLKIGTLTNHLKDVYSSADVSMFAQNYFLRDVDWGTANTFAPTTTLYLANSNQLTRQSILGLATALATTSTSRTVQLGSTNLNKLTADEKKLFTDKGYTLA